MRDGDSGVLKTVFANWLPSVSACPVLGELAEVLAGRLVALSSLPLISAAASVVESSCTVEVTTVVGARVGVAGAGPRRALPARYWKNHAVSPHIFIPHITLFGLGFSNCFSGGEASKKDFLSCKVQLQCLTIEMRIYHLCYCCPGACPLLCTFRL